MSVHHFQDGSVAEVRAHGKPLAKMSPTEQKIRKNAAQMLGNVFFGPILAKMHESPFKTEMSSGGRGGEAFGQMLDGLMIKKIVPPTGHLVTSFAGGIIQHAVARERAEALNKGNEGGTHVDVAG